MDAVTPSVATEADERDDRDVLKRGGLKPDGTAPLLKAGVWTLGVGIASATSIRLFFGGIGAQGPHTNMGWLMLIVAMMCLPFGAMIFLLGAAKWLRNRRRS